MNPAVFGGNSRTSDFARFGDASRTGDAFVPEARNKGIVSSVYNPQVVVEKLRQFQRQVRDVIVKSRTAGDLAEVSRSSSADTIYKIDTEVDPILEAFCQEWGRETPLVLVAEGLEDARGVEGPVTFPRGTREQDAQLRVIVDPIDGTRGIMYDKRAAWALAGVAPNKGPNTRLSDIEVAVMTELPTSKMAYADVLWAVKGQGARGIREALEHKKATLEAELIEDGYLNRPIGRVLTKMGKVNDEKVVEALNRQKRHGGKIGEILVGMGHVNEHDIQIALGISAGQQACDGARGDVRHHR